MIILLLLFICSSFSQLIPKPRPSEVLSNKVYELGELYKKLLVESAGFFSNSEQSVWEEESRGLENEESADKELNFVDSLKNKKRFESQSSISRNCNYGKPYDSVSTFVSAFSFPSFFPFSLLYYLSDQVESL
jgi:hypothetical protein